MSILSDEKGISPLQQNSTSTQDVESGTRSGKRPISVAPPRVVVDLWKKLAAEFLGTLVLCITGLGTIASNVYLGQYQIVPFGFSLGLFLGLQVLGHISGGHFNPAITLSFAIIRPLDMPWNDVPYYFAAQFLGAASAAGILLILLWGVIHNYEKVESLNSSSQVWALRWADGMLWGDAFVFEFLMTFALSFVIFAITNRRRSPANTRAMAPIIVPLCLTALIMMGGPFTGAGLNPARDLGPRIAASLSTHWSNEDLYNGVGVYVTAPFLGAPLGAYLAERLPAQPNTEWYSTYEDKRATGSFK